MIRQPWLTALLVFAFSLPLTAFAASKSETAQIFQAPQMYNVEGTVQEADDDDLTLNRENMPPIEMDVVSMTKVTIDGNESKATNLQPGMEVRAQFQVADDDIIATQIEAKSASGGQQGSQPQGQ